MSVTVLPSAREKNVASNLTAFVSRAIGCSAFGASLDFSSPVWNVPLNIRASSGHKSAKLYFTDHEGGTSKSMEGRTPMSEPFASFIKALIRLREEVKPKQPANHAVTIRAARYLHDILADRGHNPALLLPDDFIQACTVAKKRESASSAYRVGVNLAEIAECLNRHGLTKIRIDFVNPLPREGHTDSRIDKQSEERRRDLLPSERALEALSELANLVLEPADVIRIRCIELLVCGGWRINELLTVSADCEVEDPAFMNGEPLLDANGQQVKRYGIRYCAEKGGGLGIKWIPTAMADVARRAVADIRRVTEPAREVARWNDTHLGRAWMPDRWRELPPGRLVTGMEVEEMLDVFNGPQFLLTRNIARRVDGEVVASVADLEASFLKESSSGSTPGTGKLSDHLFLMPLNWAHPNRATIMPVVLLVTDGQISDAFAGREGVTTVFEKFGLRNLDGTAISIRSHQFRHWLNTLLQQGGMSQMEIARWSGRKDVGQNAAYDHTSGVAMAERAREQLAAGKLLGPIAEVHERLPPVRREEFRKTQFATVHTTDLGLCGNDWSLVPCMEHGSCAACSQHFIVKGDQVQRARTVELLEEHEFLLAAAVAEADDQTYGASNYVAHNKRMRDALIFITSVHDDPTIEDGNLVQLGLQDAKVMQMMIATEDAA